MMQGKKRTGIRSIGFVAPAALALMAVIVLAGGKGETGRNQRPPIFETDIAPLLETNCALSGCHLGKDAWLGLELRPEVAYANLVGQPSKEEPGLLRVQPFQPDSSYLVHKLLGVQAKGARMPLKGEPLSADQVARIIAWIEAGAPQSTLEE